MFYYIFTILKLNLFKSIIILIAYNVGFMAHNPKVAGSNPVPATILLFHSQYFLFLNPYTPEKGVDRY